LAPFASLTHLNLQHNQLQLASVAPLSQLPSLQHLDLSHNPLGGPAHCQAAQGAANSMGAARQQGVGAESAQRHSAAELVGAGAGGVFVQLQELDLSSSRIKQVQPLQELLACMPELAVLRLLNTPLAERCRAGKVEEQVHSRRQC
jgi:hypothetical protein